MLVKVNQEAQANKVQEVDQVKLESKDHVVSLVQMVIQDYRVKMAEQVDQVLMVFQAAKAFKERFTYNTRLY